MRARFLVGLALTGLLMISPAFAQSITWQKYQSEKGGFSVDMPGTPTVSTKQVNGKDTYTAQVAFKDEAGTAMAFLARYQVDPTKPGPTTPSTLKEVAKGVMEGDKVLSDKAVTISGIPARRFAFEDQDKDTMEMVTLWTGENYVQLIFLGPEGNPLGKQFLDSLVLTKG
jgi:hypothetical protein